jgi:hypothetical protein
MANKIETRTLRGLSVHIALLKLRSCLIKYAESTSVNPEPADGIEDDGHRHILQATEPTDGKAAAKSYFRTQ